MAIRSMTGFARVDGVSNGDSWVWEVRAVNAKGLDVRLRLPPGLEHIEVPARKRIGARITRGNLQLNLTNRSDAAKPRLKINEDVLDQVGAALALVRQKVEVGPSSPEGILAIRGVMESEIPTLDEDQHALISERILAGVDELMADLTNVREREGNVLAALLTTRLGALDQLLSRAEASPARTPEAIRARLSEQIETLMGASEGLDPARLHHEAVLLATKADIREELDRLGAHISAARELLENGGPVGRRLDFLAQELNREVNTLCAKSNDLELTAIGLEMKSIVDQLREQIQNLE
jgi:uncharacterized protein (TIGR00255 family)